MLGEAGSLSGSPVVVFIDGLDLMENTFLPSTMDWLPNPVPKVCLDWKSNIVKPVLRGHLWDKEKVALYDRWPLKRASIHMKCSMIGQEKGDL